MYSWLFIKDLQRDCQGGHRTGSLQGHIDKVKWTT